VKIEQGLVVLETGEVYRQQKFGPSTVNRGAILFGCEWDGGRFERGLFMGGMFRSGEFAGGFFYGGLFLNATWLGGVWEGGFDRNGLFHARSDSPDKR
jgi:hypothetical protein